jgi:hypothetical protein
MRSYILFMLISLIAIALILVTWASYVGGSPRKLDAVREQTNEGIIYETFYIEGMPCMRVGRGNKSHAWEYDGVTCDWSKWRGK